MTFFYPTNSERVNGSKNHAAKKKTSFLPTIRSDEDRSSNSGRDNTNDNEDGGKIRSNKYDSIFLDELLDIIKLAAPIVGTYLLEMMPGIVGLILVGHIDVEDNYKLEEIISATALSYAFLVLFAFSIGFGLSTAMDTLCSQAFGANESQRMGVYLQTGAVVLSFFFIIVCITFYNSTNILIMLGQPMEASKLAGQFIIYLLPGVPFVYLYELCRKVLQAQNIAFPMLVVAVLSNVINIVIGYYLVYHTSFGWLGVAVARTFCNISLPLLLISYILWTGIFKTFWTGVQIRAALDGVGEFLSLGMPGMMQLCFEWWAFELICIICGLLPGATIAIGSNTILLNVTANTYMFYLGFSVAGGVRIGNALGAGDTHRAKIASWLTIGMATVTAIMLSTLLLLFRKKIPFLFTNDEEINELVQILLRVGAIFQIPDAINGAVQGIFRGSGRQNLGAKLNFVGYYMLGIPIGLLLAFNYRQNVLGLWHGVTFGLFVVSGFGTLFVWLSKWEKLAKEAENRIQVMKTLPISDETSECQKLVRGNTTRFGSLNEISPMK
mmetsp:Transcript_21339/g.48470  ORF Transcript_21339/g.48470 Transcript_21339/m.48470 type:complete len:552 (-) Transcript_21339:31-1686(-)